MNVNCLRFVPRSKLAKYVVLPSILPIVISVSVYLFLLTAQAYSAAQAEEVLDRLEALRVGSPQADFEVAIRSCKIERESSKVVFVLESGATRFDSLISFRWKLPILWVYRVQQLLNRAGLRYWRISGAAYLRDGTIERLSTNLDVDGRYEALGTTWQLSDEVRPRYEGEILPEEQKKTYMGWYHISSFISGEGYTLYVTPQSTEAEVRARRINRSCLMSFRGCDGLCELLPDAARLLNDRKATFGGCTSVPRSWCELKHDDCRTSLEAEVSK